MPSRYRWLYWYWKVFHFLFHESARDHWCKMDVYSGLSKLHEDVHKVR